jgi:hypothetical protein
VTDTRGKKTYRVEPQHSPPFTMEDTGFNRVACMAGKQLAGSEITAEVVGVEGPRGVCRFYKRSGAVMYPISERAAALAISMPGVA